MPLDHQGQAALAWSSLGGPAMILLACHSKTPMIRPSFSQSVDCPNRQESSEEPPTWACA